MAYMRRYERKCEATNCRSRATYEVLNFRNETEGFFCTPCARRKVREVGIRERIGFGAMPGKARKGDG